MRELTEQEKHSIRTLKNLIDRANAAISMIEDGYMRSMRHSEVYTPKGVYYLGDFLVVNLNRDACL